MLARCRWVVDAAERILDDEAYRSNMIIKDPEVGGACNQDYTKRISPACWTDTNRSGSKQRIAQQAAWIARLEKIVGLHAFALAGVKGDAPAVTAANQAIQRELN